MHIATIRNFLFVAFLLSFMQSVVGKARADISGVVRQSEDQMMSQPRVL